MKDTFCSVAALALFLILNTPHDAAAAANKCVRIYYNEGTENNQEGHLQALFLENLLGHFKNVQQFVSPVEKYKEGDIDGALGAFAACTATLYLGATGDAGVPEEFVKDAAATRNHFAWLGLNVKKFGKANLSKLLNVEYEKNVRRDNHLPDAKGVSGFYRSFTYHDATFTKSVELEGKKKTFGAADEIAKVKLVGPKDKETVLSWAKHSGKATDEKKKPGQIPYVVHKDNFWLVLDAPFSYVHWADRYLITADLLFDILEEAPRYPGVRPAFVRYEDLDADIPQWQLDGFLEMMKRLKTPFAMSVIPEHVDMSDDGQGEPKNIHIKVTDRPRFPDWISEAVEAGGTVVMHGYTHQSDDYLNPGGISGWDYEFWDLKTDKPLRNDTKERTLERLEKGYAILAEAGLKPSAWLTPHYMASPLDNVVFGQVFDWAIGGVEFTPFQVTGPALPHSATFDASGVDGAQKRAEGLAKIKYQGLKVYDGFRSPYETYGDIYGQGLIPETAGYINPNKKTADYALVNDMITVLKRNKAIRDSWGSFFFHPFMLNKPKDGGIAKHEGDTDELERLINTTRQLGYEFIDLKAWIPKNGKEKRPATIRVADQSNL